MVNEHYWSHLFNLCSSFNDKSTLLDPGIGVLLAPPHTENGTKQSVSSNKFKIQTVPFESCLHPVLWGPARAPGLHSRAVRRASSWSLDALWNTERKPWQAGKCPNQPRAPLWDHSPSCWGAVKHHDFRTTRSQRQTKRAFSDLTWKATNLSISCCVSKSALPVCWWWTTSATAIFSCSFSSLLIYRKDHLHWTRLTKSAA